MPAIRAISKMAAFTKLEQSLHKISCSVLRLGTMGESKDLVSSCFLMNKYSMDSSNLAIHMVCVVTKWETNAKSSVLSLAGC